MKVVYIGHYEAGSTSRMRGEYLRKILQPTEFIVADVSIPIDATNKIFRSIGWRFYKGPLISNITKFCSNLLAKEKGIDLIWIDKAVFIRPQLLRSLRQRTQKLIHYTPDTAFTHNRSSLFYKGIADYDYCITTKSFELDDYQKAGARNVIYCTQGYDPLVHKPANTIDQKSGVAFAGLCEPYREAVLAALLEAGVPVKLAGVGWEPFLSKYKTNKFFDYRGTGLFGEAYARFYAESEIGLGLLSKKFPELHTTRHFEIPAIGTALVTERNSETASFFEEGEVIFYNDIKEMTERVLYALANPQYTSDVARKGSEKVKKGHFDYESIIRSLLKQTGVVS